MKRKIYLAGFILMALRYLYALVSRVAIWSISNSGGSEAVMSFGQINVFVAAVLSLGLFVCLVVIMILELTSTSTTRIRVMSGINIVLMVTYNLISVATGIYIGRFVTNRSLIPSSYTVGEYIFQVSIVNSAIKLIADIAIVVMMVIGYKASKRSIAKMMDDENLIAGKEA